MKKFIDKKKVVEDKICKLLNEFVKDTGINIQYISYKKEYIIGFNTNEKFFVDITIQ